MSASNRDPRYGLGFIAPSGQEPGQSRQQDSAEHRDSSSSHHPPPSKGKATKKVADEKKKENEFCERESIRLKEYNENFNKRDRKLDSRKPK